MISAFISDKFANGHLRLNDTQYGAFNAWYQSRYSKAAPKDSTLFLDYKNDGCAICVCACEYVVHESKPSCRYFANATFVAQVRLACEMLQFTEFKDFEKVILFDNARVHTARGTDGIYLGTCLALLRARQLP